MKQLTTLFIVALVMAACGGDVADADVTRGQRIFAEHCVACHSVSPEVVIVGPSLSGVATRAAAGGLDPRDALRRSILTPQAEIVEGFSNLMPPDFERKLVEADLEALLSYLLTLE